MDPLVTIGIPTLSRLSYLQEAVRSTLAQEYTNLDVIVSDEGVSSSIQEWVASLLPHDRRLRYQRNTRSRGLSANWNAVVDAAQGDYLVIIGDDDRLLPAFVSRLIAPRADVAFSNQFIIDADGALLPEVTAEWTVKYGRHLLQPGYIDDPSAAVWRNSVPMSAALVRTTVARGLPFKEDSNTPDLEFFARVAEGGGRFWFERDHLAEYRIHPASASAQGLTVGRLAEHLVNVRVPPHVQPSKRALIARLLMGAVSGSLSNGSRQEARRHLRSSYYPRDASLHLLAQRVCSGLPILGPPIYRGLRFLRHIWQHP